MTIRSRPLYSAVASNGLPSKKKFLQPVVNSTPVPRSSNPPECPVFQPGSNDDFLRLWHKSLSPRSGDDTLTPTATITSICVTPSPSSPPISPLESSTGSGSLSPPSTDDWENLGRQYHHHHHKHHHHYHFRLTGQPQYDGMILMKKFFERLPNISAAPIDKQLYLDETFSSSGSDHLPEITSVASLSMHTEEALWNRYACTL